MNAPNTEAVLAWNTILFDKFVRFRQVVTAGLAIYGDALLERHPPTRGARVLDVGCGFGDTTARIADLVGERGEAVGVDAADRFVETARREATEARIENARFIVADVQDGDLGGPYDMAFSRFGTMFFANPVAALRNVRASLAPGAKLCMTVWRRKEQNAFFQLAEEVVRTFVTPPEQHDQPTCGPGPFSMGDADVTSTLVMKAGFRDVTLERLDAEIFIGHDASQAVAVAMELGPAGEVLRLAGDEGARKRPVVEQALREAFVRFEGRAGLVAPSSAWLVTARAA